MCRELQQASARRRALAMTRWGAGLVAAAVLLTAGPSARAAAPAVLDTRALAERIDQHLFTAHAAAKVQPAPLADDAEYLRRVWLDLGGRIPSVSEGRDFLDDKRSDRRERLVASLLESPRYPSHFGRVWRSLLLPEATTSFNVRFQAQGFEGWLRKHLSANNGYDLMVRELLTMPLGNQLGRPAIMRRGGPNEPTPLGFYIAKEVKPENLGAATARLFLGLRLECAQCHNHPFAKWKREQFWSLAAFFAGVQRQGNGDVSFPAGETADRREMTIPGTERVVRAGYPDGSSPKWKENDVTRQVLADWVTSPSNPYFAKATVNRVWSYFFGHGLVEPIDDMVGSDSVNSHPPLLNDLAQQFIEHKYDLKYLIKAVTISQAYQRTSLRTHASQDDTRQFARMPLRGLSPEQLFDSLAEATRYNDGSPANQPFFPGNNSARAQFLQLFGSQPDKSTDHTTSILQALMLMNGQLTATATNLQQSGTLAAIVDAPFMDTPERIETLYLATLSRRPTAKELSKMVAYVDRGGADADKPGSPDQGRYARALADVFWALLNSGEFVLNH
jgi:hypothetical protein